MAITSTLELQLKPDSLDTAHQVLRETLVATRKFPGCLDVTVLIDNDDPAHVVLLEKWESVDHDLAYRAWRTTPDGASDLRKVLVAAPKLTHFITAEGI